MDAQELEQLERNVLAHKHHRQETYQIGGSRYVLEKSNETWVLWVYPQDGWTDFTAGNSIGELFDEATAKGVLVENLTLDQWHG